jgi:hypothetical protein
MPDAAAGILAAAAAEHDNAWQRFRDHISACPSLTGGGRACDDCRSLAAQMELLTPAAPETEEMSDG